MADAADVVLEFLALAEAVVGELGMVGYLLLRGPDLRFLPLPGLAQDLLGGDLNWGRRLVLDSSRARKLHLGVSLREEA